MGICCCCCWGVVVLVREVEGGKEGVVLVAGVLVCGVV